MRACVRVCLCVCKEKALGGSALDPQVTCLTDISPQRSRRTASLLIMGSNSLLGAGFLLSMLVQCAEHRQKTVPMLSLVLLSMALSALA